MVGGTDLAWSLLFNRAGLFGDLLFELLQAPGKVAMDFAHGEQVAALGVEQEEQAVEKGEGAAEIGFEQAVALLSLHTFQIGIDQSGASSMQNEASREVGENLLEYALFQSLSQFASVAFALAHEGIKEAWPLFGWCEGFGAEEQPEVAEGMFQVGGGESEGFFEINLIVVGGAAVGFGGVESPDFAIGDNGPIRLAAIQEGDDGSARVLIRCLAVALLVLAVEAAPPGVGEAEG